MLASHRQQTLTALVRPSSNASELEKLGAILYRGELSDASLVRQAVTEADVVVHCAAKVGDWGPIDEYRQVNVESLRVLLDACKGQALSRFIHMSSLGVYEARHHHGTDETEPLPQLASRRLFAIEGRSRATRTCITTRNSASRS